MRARQLTNGRWNQNGIVRDELAELHVHVGVFRVESRNCSLKRKKNDLVTQNLVTEFETRPLYPVLMYTYAHNMLAETYRKSVIAESASLLSGTLLPTELLII